MPVQIEMDMPTCHEDCRFYAFRVPKTNLIWCNADNEKHMFLSYEERCNNCPLKEVKQYGNTRRKDK